MSRLDVLKCDFLDKVSKFNSYIDRNPQNIEPEIKKIVDYYIELATLASNLVSGRVRENPYNSLEETYNQIMKNDGIFKSCYTRMREIIIKKKVLNSKGFVELTFFDKNEVNDILDLFDKMVRFGCYQVPVSSVIRESKKKVICDTVAMAYEVWKNKQLDATYQYDDVAAYLLLRDLYISYRESLVMADGNRVGAVYDIDGCEVINTNESEEMLMNILDNLIKYIGNNCKVDSNVLREEKT